MSLDVEGAHDGRHDDLADVIEHELEAAELGDGQRRRVAHEAADDLAGHADAEVGRRVGGALAHGATEGHPHQGGGQLLGQEGDVEGADRCLGRLHLGPVAHCHGAQRRRGGGSTPTIHPTIHPWVDAGATPDPDTGGMTFSDYVIDIALISIVLVQMRGRQLTTRSLLLPVGLVTYVAITYLKAIPTSGNDLFLIVGCAVVGATLGGLAARFTTVHANSDGIPIAKAGLVAAALWILGTAGRLAFQVYASHGGGRAIEHFSVTHSITAATAWTAALILMALSEAIVRTGVLAWRGHLVQQSLRDQVQPLGATFGASPTTTTTTSSVSGTQSARVSTSAGCS